MKKKTASKEFVPKGLSRSDILIGVLLRLFFYEWALVGLIFILFFVFIFSGKKTSKFPEKVFYWQFHCLKKNGVFCLCVCCNGYRSPICSEMNSHTKKQ